MYAIHCIKFRWYDLPKGGYPFLIGRLVCSDHILSLWGLRGVTVSIWLSLLLLLGSGSFFLSPERLWEIQVYSSAVPSLATQPLFPQSFKMSLNVVRRTLAVCLIQACSCAGFVVQIPQGSGRSHFVLWQLGV